MCDIKASIIVLSYKNLSMLASCISSIEKQDYKNIEIVISDDATPNIDYVEIENSINSILKGKFPYKLIYNNENLGTVKNFKNAISQSTGDIIIPLAIDDCFYSNNVVAMIVDYFNSNPDTFLLTSYKVIGNTNNVYPYFYEIKKLNNPHKTLKYIYKYGNFITGACLVYNRKVFSKIGEFDEKYFLLEDLPFIVKSLKNSIRIHFLPEITIRYGNSGVNSGKRNPLLIKDLALFYENEIKTCKWYVKRYLKYRKNNLVSSLYRKLKYVDIIIILKLHKAYLKILKLFWRH